MLSHILAGLCVALAAVAFRQYIQLRRGSQRWKDTPLMPSDLRELALGLRGAPKSLPQLSGQEVAWKVAQPQLEIEAEFIAFALLYTRHEGVVAGRKEAYRRGIATALVWHGYDPSEPPTAALHDALHKESFHETESGDGV